MAASQFLKGRRNQEMSKITRQYAYNGLAGCVTQQKDEDMGLSVGLYCAEQAGIDADGPWITVCERHGTICSHTTQQRAKEALALVEWCEVCQATDMLKFARMLFHLRHDFYKALLFVGRNRQHAFQLARQWSLNGLQGCIFSTGDQRDCFQDDHLVKPLEMYYRGDSAPILNALGLVGLPILTQEVKQSGFALLTIPHYDAGKLTLDGYI